MSIEVMELFDIFSKTYSKNEAQTIVKDIESLIADHKKELATKTDLHHEISEAELRLTKEISDSELRLTKEISDSKSSTIKWVIGFMISQTVLILTVITLLKLT